MKLYLEVLTPASVPENQRILWSQGPATSEPASKLSSPEIEASLCSTLITYHMKNKSIIMIIVKILKDLTLFLSCHLFHVASSLVFS